MEKFNEKDTVYQRKKGITAKFEFDHDVANCFDDMVSRSIPFYDEIHRIIIDLVNRYYKSNNLIYDLGCSTGTTIQNIHTFLNQQNIPSKFIGIDNSPHMVKKAKEKLSRQTTNVNAELICADIESIELKKSQIVIMNYTLQFIPFFKREVLLKKIYDSLLPGGIFILSEKVKTDESPFDHLLTDLYYDFKRRNGYSELEIAKKREALDNILVPITSNEQLSLMKQSGFTKSKSIFRWYNFACFIGIK